jgi:hypothetical protein
MQLRRNKMNKLKFLKEYNKQVKLFKRNCIAPAYNCGK